MSLNKTPWQNGHYQHATQAHSENYSARPTGLPVNLIVLHNISLPPFEYGTQAIHALFTNQLHSATEPFLQSIAHLRVSSHFVIERNGHLTQYVSCDDMAYHAGISSFRNRQRCNEFSIGIELEGCDFEPFTEAQYRTLISLLHEITQHYPIEAICGHNDIAPERKTDPGHFFDWTRLIDLPIMHKPISGSLNRHD